MYAWFIILKISQCTLPYKQSEIQNEAHNQKKNKKKIIELGKAPGGLQEIECLFQVYWLVLDGNVNI